MSKQANVHTTKAGNLMFRIGALSLNDGSIMPIQVLAMKYKKKDLSGSGYLMKPTVGRYNKELRKFEREFGEPAWWTFAEIKGLIVALEELIK